MRGGDVPMQFIGTGVVEKQQIKGYLILIFLEGCETSVINRNEVFQG
jgi:hypothetical protein